MQRSSKGKMVPVVLAIAILLAIGSLAYSYYEISSLNSTVSSLQKQSSSTLQEIAAPPMIRNVTVEWAQLNSFQDRFYPDYVVVDQGDTVYLTFINNDTEFSHTFTANLTTTACPHGCLYQINDSAAGLANELTGAVFRAGATDCVNAGVKSTCTGMVHGTVGNLTGLVSFTVTKPGIFRYYCYYSENVGMFGYLVVLPNADYTNSTA